MHASGVTIAIGAAVVAIVAVFAGSYLFDMDGSSAYGDVEMENETYAELKVGEIYVWKLESNPTTGFDWHIRDVDNISVEREYVSKQIPGPYQLAGAGGTTVFKITSDEPGDVTIYADYDRAWETVEPAKTAVLHLRFV